MDINNKKIKRFEFLKHLYETVDGSPSYMVDMWELGRELNFDRELTSKIVDYLTGEGLLQPKALGGSIGITHYGVIEIEESLSNPDEPTEHFVPFNIINIENMSNSAIQQGNVNSTQNSTFNLNKIDELKELVRLLEDSLEHFQLKTEKQTELIAEVETLKSQSKSPKPKTVIINESLKTVRSLIEGVAAGAMTPGIMELLQNLMK